MDRWSYLSSQSGLLELRAAPPRWLKRLPLFKSVDYEHLHLASEDMAVAKWRPGTVLFREGSYIDLAFFILSGQVKLMSNVQAQPERLHAGSFALQNLWSLPDGGGLLKMRLGPDDFFGEIGAVNGWPQPFAAITESECQLLHIRMPALRRLRNKVKTLEALLGNEYSRQVVLGVLRGHTLFKNTNEHALAELAQAVRFKCYTPGEVIARAGETAHALYVIRAGFARLMRTVVEEPTTINYLAPGDVFGASEFLQQRPNLFAHTLAAYEYGDVLEISHESLNEIARYDFSLHQRLHEAARKFNEKCGTWSETMTASPPAAFSLFAESISRKSIDAPPDISILARRENIIAHGLLQGESTMLIDYARCTHCNDCVRACADTHEGLPRFVREGKVIENWMIAESCRHCHDPLCLIGCPTGAIARRGQNAIVEIDDDLCIGCKSCAVHCPFDAIIMHDTGTVWSTNDALAQDNMIGKARLVASKCDNCTGKPHAQACVMACPTGCLVRVENVGEFLESQQL